MLHDMEKLCPNDNRTSSSNPKVKCMCFNPTGQIAISNEIKINFQYYFFLYCKHLYSLFYINKCIPIEDWSATWKCDRTSRSDFKTGRPVYVTRTPDICRHKY